MPIDPAILKAMAAAGASVEVIIAAVEAAKAADDEAIAARRAKAAAKKARQRAAKRPAMSPDVPGTGGDTEGTAGDGTPPSSPPKAPRPQNTPPIIPPHSDPNGSAPAVAVAGDDREWLFDDGVKQLTIWGKSDKASRSIIGKWLKSTNDNAELVRKAIQAAADRRVVVPVEWIEQGLKARMERNDEQSTRQDRTHPPARPQGTAARVAAIMGYGPQSDGDGSEEERRLPGGGPWPEGRDTPGIIDAHPGPTGIYRA